MGRNGEGVEKSNERGAILIICQIFFLAFSATFSSVVGGRILKGGFLFLAFF